jgi:hypothetical protein
MHTAGRYFLVYRYLLDHVLAVVALSAVLVMAGLALATPAQNELFGV